MRLFLTFLLILGASFFQSFFLPVNLVLVLVIVFSLGKKEPESFVWAFLSGLFLDWFSFGQIGRTSLIFVGLDFVLKLYRQRFSLDHPVVLSLVLLASYGAYSLLSGREIRLGEGLVLLAIILLWRFWQKEMFLGFSGREGGKLKL